MPARNRTLRDRLDEAAIAAAVTLAVAALRAALFFDTLRARSAPRTCP